MRIVGKYNGKDIHLEDMHITYTYLGWLCGSAEIMNKQLFKEGLLDKWVKDTSVCPEGQKYHVIDREKYLKNIKKKLPVEKVVASFQGDPVEGKGVGCWSGAVLVWFQDGKSNPIEEAKKNLAKVNWEEIAVNWEP